MILVTIFPSLRSLGQGRLCCRAIMRCAAASRDLNIPNVRHATTSTTIMAAAEEASLKSEAKLENQIKGPILFNIM